MGLRMDRASCTKSSPPVVGTDWPSKAVGAQQREVMLASKVVDNTTNWLTVLMVLDAGEGVDGDLRIP